MLTDQAATISPAFRLLIELARSSDASQCAEIVERAGPDVGWNEFSNICFQHGMYSHVWRMIENQSADIVPEAVTCWHRKLERRTGLQHELLIDELVGMVAALNRAGIDALPFKGPQLAQSLYGDPLARPYNDIDLLVAPAEHAAAIRVLVEQGYKLFTVDDGRRTANTLRKFTTPRLRSEIDLHRRLFQEELPFVLDFEQLWERRQPSTIAGATIPCLSNEDLFLVLSIHGGRHIPHPWCRLLWIADIDRCLQGKIAVDWRLAFERAGQIGARRIAAIAVLLAADVFDRPLPAEVERAIAGDSAALPLVAEVKRWVLAGADPQLGVFDAHRWRIRSRERLGDRLKYARHLVRISTAKALQVHPRPGAAGPESLPMRGWRHVVRPFELLFKYGLPRW